MNQFSHLQDHKLCFSTSIVPPHIQQYQRFGANLWDLNILCASQSRTWISNVNVVGFFFCSVSSVKMTGDCSFCWYWWNWWSSLFKLSFHNKGHFVFKEFQWEQPTNKSFPLMYNVLLKDLKRSVINTTYLLDKIVLTLSKSGDPILWQTGTLSPNILLTEKQWKLRKLCPKYCPVVVTKKNPFTFNEEKRNRKIVLFTTLSSWTSN
jgi:hypothetical protein